MSEDRQLIDRIKERFARKPTAQLQQIARADGHADWSAEALAAAREVLLDRAAGRAAEPTDVEEDSPPPPSGHDVNSLALMAGLNVLALPLGFVVLPVNRPLEDDPVARDQPVPFGPGTAWVAAATTDTAGVAAVLELRGVREATWRDGVAAAGRGAVFVTPPVGEWTLAVSAALLPPRRAGEFVRPLLERLSGPFKEAQYFCAHEGAGAYAWARAAAGRLVRGYARFDREGLPAWDEGSPTREERELGLPPAGEPLPEAGQREQPGEAQVGEEGVLQLAAYWSVDPTTLDGYFKEPMLGLLGELTRPPAS